MRALWIGLTCLLVGSFSVHASAQDAEAEARARFEAGRAAFDAEHYEDALADFRRAHELSHRPELLYNVGASAELLARDPEALEAFTAFVEALPDHPLHDETLRRIAAIEARMRAEQEDTSDTEPAPQPPAATARHESGWVASWIALALTAGSAAGIGIAWALANDAYASLDRTCGARGCTDAEIAASDVQTRLDATTAMWIVTGVLAAATITLFVLEAPGVLGGTTETSVAIGPGAVQLRGTF